MKRVYVHSVIYDKVEMISSDTEFSACDVWTHSLEIISTELKLKHGWKTIESVCWQCFELGRCSSPGGEKKLFTTAGADIHWWKNKKFVMVKGKQAGNVKRLLILDLQLPARQPCWTY